MARGILGFLALAVTCGALPLQAQEKFAPTRIALINIGEVFKNYNKANVAKKEMEAVLGPYKIQGEKMRAETTKLQQLLVDQKADEDAKSEAAKKLTLLRRKLEDLEAEARKTIAKRQETILQDLYTEVHAAVERYADVHDIDLVLIHGDPPKDDVFKFANINRKLNAADQGGVVPFFIRQRIDITQAVLRELNGTSDKTPKK